MQLRIELNPSLVSKRSIFDLLVPTKNCAGSSAFQQTDHASESSGHFMISAHELTFVSLTHLGGDTHKWEVA